MPLAGDICWCHFPHKPALGEPGPKPRPALILAVYRGAEQGQFRVAVCYGTSQKTQQLYAGEFAITPEDGEAFRLAGLSYPTKFNLREEVILPFNGHWFSTPPAPQFGQEPKLGSLHPALLRRLRAAREA